MSVRAHQAGCYHDGQVCVVHASYKHFECGGEGFMLSTIGHAEFHDCMLRTLKAGPVPLSGCHWSLGPALSSELFGLRRFATLYCLLNYSTTLGAYLLAMRLVRAPAHVSCSRPSGLEHYAGAV